MTTHDWAEKYEKIKKAVDVGPAGKYSLIQIEHLSFETSSFCGNFAGFIKHEAVGWSEYHKSWLFIPRFIVGKYNDSDAGRILSKKMIFSSEDFTSLQVKSTKLYVTLLECPRNIVLCHRLENSMDI